MLSLGVSCRYLWNKIGFSFTFRNTGNRAIGKYDFLFTFGHTLSTKGHSQTSTEGHTGIVGKVENGRNIFSTKKLPLQPDAALTLLAED